MTTSSVSLPPLAEITWTLAGGIGVLRVVSVFKAPSPNIPPRDAPFPVMAVSAGGEVSSLVEADNVSIPEARLYSALWMVT